MGNQTQSGLNTPILFIIFNRPETTARVFEAIRKVRPRQLFIAADGPRAHVPAEAERCRNTREIVTQVDWDCEVRTLLRKRNLGCRMAVSSAITWFFQHVEEGIILEDDILPSPEFYQYCSELLECYRNESRIMMISADNFQMGVQRGEHSYYFSRFAHIWGWASWRRAWKYYIPERSILTRLKHNGFFEQTFPLASDRAYWQKRFEETLRGEIDTWDYLWQMSIWSQNGLSISPNVNLASNIGFNIEATHTVGESKLANLPVEELGPLHHPDTIEPHYAADAFTQKYIFSGRFENPDAIAIDIASSINSGRPDEGAALAGQFLTLHPGNPVLEWLQLLSLHIAGQLTENLVKLKEFIKKYPQHPSLKNIMAATSGLASVPDIKRACAVAPKENICVDDTALLIANEPQFAILRRLIHPSSIIFDIGAGIGGWSLAVGKNYPQAKLHIFEPNPLKFHCLATVVRNNLSQAKLFPFAVTHEVGSKTFLYSTGTTDSSGRLARQKEPSGNNALSCTVQCTTLDAYCQDHGIHHIDAVCIETHRYESILNGAEKLISSGAIDLLLFRNTSGTITRHTLSTITDFLDFRGYILYAVHGNAVCRISSAQGIIRNFSAAHFVVVHSRLRSWFEHTPPMMPNIKAQLQKAGIKVRGIIHIGAHEGEEFEMYNSMGASHILFIEANPDLAEQLQKKVAGQQGVIVASCAITDGKTSTTTLHITSMNQSSSILPLKEHKTIYPEIVETHSIVVPAKTLDALINSLGLDPTMFNFLNIDIQGAELLALHGAKLSLPHIEAINTEINFRELYAGCALAHELDAYLADFGFIRESTHCPYDPSWGDAFYIKKSSISMSTLGSNGRFANQIFQYAFLRHYAERHHLAIETPEWMGTTIFDLKDPVPSKAYPRINQTDWDNFANDAIAGSQLPLKNVDIWGYFQFPELYSSPEGKQFFRKLFTPKPQINKILRQATSLMMEGHRTLVAVHLRRGDYGYNCFFRSPTKWYLNWLKSIWADLPAPLLYIASDELDSVLEDFSAYNPVSRANLGDLDLLDDLCPFYPDFFVLSQAHRLAISNSSFSFAAAMLNETATEFVRPRLGLGKLIPFDPFCGPTIFRDEKID